MKQIPNIEDLYTKIDDYYRNNFDESQSRKKMFITELLHQQLQKAVQEEKLKHCCCLIENSKVIERCKLHGDELQKATEEGYEKGYSRGLEVGELQDEEAVQKARQDGYNAGLADGTDKPLLAIEQRVQKAREQKRVEISQYIIDHIKPGMNAKETLSIIGDALAPNHSELDQDKQ